MSLAFFNLSGKSTLSLKKSKVLSIKTTGFFFVFIFFVFMALCAYVFGTACPEIEESIYSKTASALEIFKNEILECIKRRFYLYLYFSSNFSFTSSHDFAFSGFLS